MLQLLAKVKMKFILGANMELREMQKRVYENKLKHGFNVSNVELEFLSSVMKISEQIDGQGTDANVPKAVSQLIANDIKKDKTIKRSKKDKKDEDENN